MTGEHTRALTVHQPYATLIALGEKRIETRSWATLYRGPLVIHAGRNMEGLNYLSTCLSSDDPTGFGSAVGAAIHRHYAQYSIKSFPLGMGLAVADLVDCVRIDSQFALTLSDQERVLGLYTSDRAAWVFKNVRPFPQPLPCLGSQGLWTWDEELPT